MKTIYPKEPASSFNEWIEYIKKCNDENHYNKKD